jgi:hypothetical protein
MQNKGSRNIGAMKALCVVLSYIIYSIAVIYGDIMFIMIMQKTFPAGFLGSMAIVGAIATALSAMLLPLAKWQWFRNGMQMVWSWLFWIMEITILVLNAMLAHAIAGGDTDTALLVWAQFSPASPLFCVLGWGLCFFLDESTKRKHQQEENEDQAWDYFSDEYSKAVKSDEVYRMLQTGALDQARTFVEAMTHNRPPLENRKPLQLASRTLGIPGGDISSFDLQPTMITRRREPVYTSAPEVKNQCLLCPIAITPDDIGDDKAVRTADGRLVHRACLSQALLTPRANPTQGGGIK